MVERKEKDRETKSRQSKHTNFWSQKRETSRKKVETVETCGVEQKNLKNVGRGSRNKPTFGREKKPKQSKHNQFWSTKKQQGRGRKSRQPNHTHFWSRKSKQIYA